jgi:hypothetical protein
LLRTPNVHTLDYCGDAISLSSNAFTLSEVNLNLCSYTPLDVEKIEFLAKLSHPKLLTWSAFCDKVFYFLLFDSLIVYFVHQLLSFVINI